MPYYLRMNNSSGYRDFTFEIETTRKSWLLLRLIRIADEVPHPGVPQVEHYNRLIHDGTSHSMGWLWKARRRKKRGEYVLYLVGPFGEENSFTLELDNAPPYGYGCEVTEAAHSGPSAARPLTE